MNLTMVRENVLQQSKFTTVPLKYCKISFNKVNSSRSFKAVPVSRFRVGTSYNVINIETKI